MCFSHIADEKLIAFASKELGESELNIVRDHIARCTECNQMIIAFKAVVGLMYDDCGQDPPQVTVIRAHAIFHQPPIGSRSVCRPPPVVR